MFPRIDADEYRSTHTVADTAVCRYPAYSTATQELARRLARTVENPVALLLSSNIQCLYIRRNGTGVNQAERASTENLGQRVPMSLRP